MLEAQWHSWLGQRSSQSSPLSALDHAIKGDNVHRGAIPRHLIDPSCYETNAWSPSSPLKVAAAGMYQLRVEKVHCLLSPPP